MSGCAASVDDREPDTCESRRRRERLHLGLLLATVSCMSATSVLALVAFVAAVVIWRSLSSPIDRAVRSALTQKSISPIVDALGRKSAARQPTAYNVAIRRLWDGYERGMAAQLVRQLAELHHTEQIAQYWIELVLQTEPGIARQAFDQAFLDTYYVPEVAAQCGKVG